MKEKITPKYISKDEYEKANNLITAYWKQQSDITKHHCMSVSDSGDLMCRTGNDGELLVVEIDEEEDGLYWVLDEPDQDILI